MIKDEATKALQKIAGSVAFWTYNEDGTLRSSADLRTGDMAYDMIVEIRDILTSLGIEISDKEDDHYRKHSCPDCGQDLPHAGPCETCSRLREKEVE